MPDLVLADDRYLLGRYDWSNYREVRVITADGMDKVMDKGKYGKWLDKYVADRFVSLNDCFKRNPDIVGKLLEAFEKEGYIRTLEPGMRFEWLHSHMEFACLIHELWYSYGDTKTVPGKTISRYISGYEARGDSFRQELSKYRHMCPDEWGSNWDGDKFNSFVLRRGGYDDNYVRILKIIRKIVHADGA